MASDEFATRTDAVQHKPLLKSPTHTVDELEQTQDPQPPYRHEHKLLLQDQLLSPNSRSAWKPRQFKTWYLCTFAIIYLVLAIVLAGLYAFSATHHGLAKDHEQWHYVFKYGPTAILTVLAAIWAKVEYRTKQLAPWHALAEGWTSAERSIMLDYLSSWNVLVLPKALTAGHYTVATSISASLLTKLLIVISAGLFVSQDQVLQQQSSGPTKAFRVPDGFTGTHVDELPFLNLQSSRDTTYPLGTSQLHAFQPFSIPSDVLLAQPQIDALVDVFTSDLTCDAAGGSFPDGYGTAATSDCELSWTSVEQELGGKLISMQPISCQKGEEDLPGDTSRRFLICAMNAEDVDNGGVGDFGLAGCGSGCSVKATNITCLACSPSYNIVSGTVVMADGKAIAVKTANSAALRQIHGLSAWQMGMSVFQALGVTPPINFLGYGQSALEFGNVGFETLLNITQPGVLEDYGSLYNATLLETVSKHAFQSLAAQTAQLHFTSLSNDTSVKVNYDAVVSRVLVQTSIFIAMESCMVVLVALSLLLASLTAATRVVSRDPSSLLGLTAILARSPDLVTILRDAGHASLGGLRKQVAAAKFRTTKTGSETSGTFKIDALSSHHEATEGSLSSTTNKAPLSWRPFALTLWCNITLQALPLSLSAILISTLLKSQRSQGILNLSSNNSLNHYGWTLIPAAVFLGTKVLFGTLENALDTMHPFYELSNKNLKHVPKADPKD